MDIYMCPKNMECLWLVQSKAEQCFLMSNGINIINNCCKEFSKILGKLFFSCKIYAIVILRVLIIRNLIFCKEKRDMKETLHYLLMADYLLVQKSLLAGIKDTDLTPGQPKILDYLLFHDGAVQKEIAKACHIEPATITSVLLGMENKGLIVRRNINGNRRSLYVYLTDKGRQLAEQVALKFRMIEEKALSGFRSDEKEMLTVFLTRMNENLLEKGVVGDE